jgi:pantoate--beta-alanine ligase
VETVTTIAAARRLRQRDRDAGSSVAFVPTMGALHRGHLALVERAHAVADRVWVSVFVNPTQFGPGEDFERYPRDLGNDSQLLLEAGVDALFAPTVEEMYPRPPVVRVTFSGLDEVLCGARRRGHFSGVGLVVAKLLNIVQPDRVLFGEKDAQQALLVRRLVRDLDFPVDVEVLPTVRESDGLALSSRNAFLDPEQRRAATAIHRALELGRAAIAEGEREPRRVEEVMAAEIAQEPLLELEYARCVGIEDLATPMRIDRAVLLAIAASSGATRLIDNLTVAPPGASG